VQLALRTASTCLSDLSSTQLAAELRRNAPGARLDRRRVPGAGHGGIVVAGAKPATTWIGQRLR
jgi:hypothetical protein